MKLLSQKKNLPGRPLPSADAANGPLRSPLPVDWAPPPAASLTARGLVHEFRPAGQCRSPTTLAAALSNVATQYVGEMVP